MTLVNTTAEILLKVTGQEIYDDLLVVCDSGEED